MKFFLVGFFFLKNIIVMNLLKFLGVCFIDRFQALLQPEEKHYLIISSLKILFKHYLYII